MQGQTRQKKMKGLCYDLLGTMAGLLDAVFEKEQPDAEASVDGCLRQPQRVMCFHDFDCFEQALQTCDQHIHSTRHVAMFAMQCYCRLEQLLYKER